MNDTESTDEIEFKMKLCLTDERDSRFHVGVDAAGFSTKRYDGYLFFYCQKTPSVRGSIDLLRSGYDGSACDVVLRKNTNSAVNINYTFNGVERTAGIASSYQEIFTGGFNRIFANITSGCAGSQIEYLKVFKSDGTTLKHNLVAARRKIDGAPAMVDTITKEIYDCDSNAFKTSKDI